MTADRALNLSVAFAALGFACAGCARETDQPWRKALDEGRVYKLGGGVGPITPDPNPAPAVVVTPPVVIHPTTGRPVAPAKTSDDIPAPPPPKGADKKSSPAANVKPIDEGPSLGPPK